MAQSSATLATPPSLVSFTGDPNAYTMFDYSRMSNSPLVHKATSVLYKNKSILADVPMKTKKVQVMNGARYDGTSMPRVDYTKINQDPIGTKSTPTDYSEKLYLIRNLSDMDEVLMNDENAYDDNRGQMFDQYLASWTAVTNDLTVNNDHRIAGANLQAPVGWKQRISDPVFGAPSDMLINAGGLNLSASGSVSDAIQFNATVDNLLENMGNINGTESKCYTSQSGKVQWAASIKKTPGGGGWNVDQDNYDRRIDKYNDMPVQTAGRKIDQQTQVISQYENAAGNTTTDGSGNFTSFYIVRYGVDFFSGWHWGPLSPSILKTIDNGVTQRVLFKYYYGFWVPNIRSIARIYNVQIR